jgi:replicative DNA helicase
MACYRAMRRIGYDHTEAKRREQHLTCLKKRNIPGFIRGKEGVKVVNDSTTHDHGTTTDELALTERAIEVLTRQRDKLSQAKRGYLDGDEVDLLEARLKARRVLDLVLPLTVTPESIPLEYSVQDLLRDYWNQVSKRKNTAATGFTRLNEVMSGGIEDGRLVVVLGAPNTGKTTFVHQMSDHIANSGRPVLYVTSEDSPSALLAKTLARIGELQYTAVLKGWEKERAKIDAALAQQFERVSSTRLRYLDASNGIDMLTIREKAAAHFANYPQEQGGGPGVLVVDYLQRIARAIKSRGNVSADLREVVTMVAEQLRALAGELHCGVIAIASQNRAGYTRGESGSMASAKESGDIEYTCDVLMALGEDKDRKKAVPHLTPISLYVDKNRQGQRGQVIGLDFWPDRQQFTEVGDE